MSTVGEWVMGLDGGGSKTALAYLHVSGALIGPFVGPGINPFDQPAWSVRLAELLATHPVPGDLTYATLGLPGYGEAPEVSEQQLAACAALISAPHSVMNDVEVAFRGAFGSAPGALLLAGTGSMVWASDGRQTLRTGGWGDAFGDEGGAYWIGRQALSLASRAIDGRWPDDTFASALLAPVLNLEEGTSPNQAQVLSWTYSLPHARSGIAALARQVDRLADAGQPTAQGLLRDAAILLADHVRAARERLKAPDLPWSGAGSVLHSHSLSAHLRAHLGPPQSPQLSPLGGALAHAAHLAGWSPIHAANLERGLTTPTIERLARSPIHS